VEADAVAVVEGLSLLTMIQPSPISTTSPISSPTKAGVSKAPMSSWRPPAK
jgi:hypothetical protein